MNKILINNRSFLLNFKSSNKQILKALSFNTSGVQISFLEYEDLLNFKPNNKVKDKLKSTFNVFHAPTNHVYYNNPITNKILKKLKKLYSDCNCKCIIFHHNNLFDPNYVSDCLKNCTLSVENLDIRTKINNSVKYLKNFLQKFPKFKLTLDFCHAMSHSRHMLNSLIQELSSKVVNIHWSLNKSQWFRHHSPNKLKKDLQKDVDFMIRMLKKLDQPIVLEIRRNYVFKDSKIIENEIKFLEKNL